MKKNIVLALALVSGLCTGFMGNAVAFNLNPHNVPLSFEKSGKNFVPLIAEVELDQQGKVIKIIRVLPLKTKIKEIKEVIKLMVTAELKKQAKKQNKTLEELAKEEEVVYNILKTFAEGAVKIGEGVFLTAYVAGKYVAIPVTRETIKILGKAGSKLGEKGVELKDTIYKWYDKKYTPGSSRDNPVIID